MTQHDPLREEIDRIKREEPAPRFSGVGKANVLAAMDQIAEESASPIQSLLEGLVQQIRPVFIGGFAAIGAMGLFVGALTAPTTLASAEPQELSPEAELAEYYDYAFAFELEAEDVLEEGLN